MKNYKQFLNETNIEEELLLTNKIYSEKEFSKLFPDGWNSELNDYDFHEILTNLKNGISIKIHQLIQNAKNLYLSEQINRYIKTIIF